MGKSQANGDPSPDVSDSDMMDFLNMDGDGEDDCDSPKKDSTIGERRPSVDVDVDQSVMDVDFEGLLSVVDEGKEQSSAMDVELEGTLSVEDVDFTGTPGPVDFNVASLERFCKEATRAFISENGLVSHQINSFNDFVSHGLQELIDSIGEITVEPDYDPSNKDGAWKYASVKFCKVTLEEPVFMVENSDLAVQDLKLKPRHARLQKMTYSSRMNVEMTVQVRMLPISPVHVSYQVKH